MFRQAVAGFLHLRAVDDEAWNRERLCRDLRAALALGERRPRRCEAEEERAAQRRPPGAMQRVLVLPISHALLPRSRLRGSPSIAKDRASRRGVKGRTPGLRSHPRDDLDWAAARRPLVLRAARDIDRAGSRDAG